MNLKTKLEEYLKENPTKGEVIIHFLKKNYTVSEIVYEYEKICNHLKYSGTTKAYIKEKQE